MDSQRYQSLVEADLSSLKNQIEQLSANANIPLSELPQHPEIQRQFESVKLAIAMMYDTDIYSRLITLLNEISLRVGPVRPGTIGAFLFGCFQTLRNGTPVERVPSEIGLACSPLCIGSAPSIGSGGGNRCCPDQVWALDEHGLLIRFSPADTRSRMAYLYVPSTFEQLTRDQINMLRSAGVNSVQLVREIDDGYRLVPGLIDLRRGNQTSDTSPPAVPVPVQPIIPTETGNLAQEIHQSPKPTMSQPIINAAVPPVAPGQVTPVYAPPPAYQFAPFTSTSSTAWIWLIIIVIIIIILLVIFSRKQSASATPTFVSTR